MLSEFSLLLVVAVLNSAAKSMTKNFQEISTTFGCYVRATYDAYLHENIHLYD